MESYQRRNTCYGERIGTVIRIYKDTKIYVLCPSRCVTGGPESIHNLVDRLRRFGHDAKIVYLPDINNPTPDEYKDYYIEYTNRVEDKEHNILIVPEIWTDKLNDYNAIQKSIWWLSVDNHFSNGNKFDFNNSLNRKIAHLFQSKYVEKFLVDSGAAHLHPLNSSLNKIFYNKFKEKKREDYVLYNPSKGFEFTSQLMQIAPTLNWKAIKKMSRDEIVNLMRKSKLYIDFGPFPGRDRMPREAALNGCCLIVGHRGAANFYQDIPISPEYKFKVDPLESNTVIKKMQDCLTNYEERVKDFGYCRRKIQATDEQFKIEVTQIFGKQEVGLKNRLKFISFCLFCSIKIQGRDFTRYIKRLIKNRCPRPILNILLQIYTKS